MKKIIAIILSVTMLLPCAVSAHAEYDDVDWSFENPYENIDWDTYKGYKAQLHCHTTASDGYLTIQESIAEHYAYDYDIVAITDHGVANKGWDKVPQTAPLVREIKKERTGGGSSPIIPLSAEEYKAYIGGTAEKSYTYEEDGNSYTIARTHENGMLDVELGDELNLATPVCDCHLTGYWSDYGQGYAGVFGDYETPSAEVTKDGGVTMLSHIGEYVYKDKDSADHVSNKVDEYYVNKFARIFLDNPTKDGDDLGSSVGMGINSATDAHTRCDRILYDQILQKTIPNGVTPWGFTFSDSHNATSVNDAYCICYMPALTNAALRSCMENGELFAVSHYSNGYELENAAGKIYQEMDGYNDDPNSVRWNDNDTPLVTKVEIDDENDVIKVWGENFDYITWVSDGYVVKREYDVQNGYAELDLHASDLEDDLHLFVRFYITGENGICYSQPIVIRANGETFEPVTVPETHDLPAFLRKLVTVLDWLFFKINPFVWAFKYFAMGYDPFAQIGESVAGIFR